MLTLALDIGGTKIAVGLVDPAGELVQSCIEPTPKDQHRRTCLGCARSHDRRRGPGRRRRGPRGRHRSRRAHRRCRRNRQPGQYRLLARVSAARPGCGRAARCAGATRPATPCAWPSASIGVAPAAAPALCSAWWCRPAWAAGWCSTASRITGGPAMPATSATSWSNSTGQPCPCGGTGCVETVASGPWMTRWALANGWAGAAGRRRCGARRSGRSR